MNTNLACRPKRFFIRIQSAAKPPAA